MPESTAEENTRILRAYLAAVFEDNTYREALVSDEFVALVNDRHRGTAGRSGNGKP